MSGINVSAFKEQIQLVQAGTKPEAEVNKYVEDMAKKVFNNGKENYLSDEELFRRLNKLYGIGGEKNQWLKNTLFEGNSRELKGNRNEWKNAGGQEETSNQGDPSPIPTPSPAPIVNNESTKVATKEATKEADGNILHQELNQAKNGNCACLAVLSAMARDYHLREEVLEPSIVKQADGSFRVYLPGADKELNGQEAKEAKNDFGKDGKGFYATVSKADLNKYKNLITADSDKDYLVLVTAAEKFAQTYGIRGDKSTLDGMYPAGLISLFTGKDGIQANANNPEALAAYFGSPERGTIVFGGKDTPTRQLDKDADQVITGKHAYGLVPLANGNFELINPWDTKHPMVVTKTQLREYLTKDGYINFIRN
jgi:hypothetical protein